MSVDARCGLHRRAASLESPTDGKETLSTSASLAVSGRPSKRARIGPLHSERRMFSGPLPFSHGLHTKRFERDSLTSRRPRRQTHAPQRSWNHRRNAPGTECTPRLTPACSKLRSIGREATNCPVMPRPGSPAKSTFAAPERTPSGCVNALTAPFGMARKPSHRKPSIPVSMVAGTAQGATARGFPRGASEPSRASTVLASAPVPGGSADHPAVRLWVVTV